MPGDRPSCKCLSTLGWSDTQLTLSDIMGPGWPIGAQIYGPRACGRGIELDPRGGRGGAGGRALQRGPSHYTSHFPLACNNAIAIRPEGQGHGLGMPRRPPRLKEDAALYKRGTPLRITGLRLGVFRIPINLLAITRRHSTTQPKEALCHTPTTPQINSR